MLSPTAKCVRILPRLQLGGHDDRLRSGLEKTERGGDHLVAGVARVPSRAGRDVKKAQGAMAKAEKKQAGTRAPV